MIAKKTYAALCPVALVAFAATGCGSGADDYTITATEDLTTSTSINGCTDISVSGTYALSADLTGGDQSCIAIHDTSNVTLDCQHHTITATAPAISVANVNGYTLKNCDLQPGEGGASAILSIHDSSNGNLTSNTVGHDSSTPQGASTNITVSHSSKLTVKSNTFHVPFQLGYSTGTVVSKNTLSCSLTFCNALLFVQFGSSNQFVSNKIDGKAGVNVGLSSPGADDGVVLWDETSDLVESNSIQNVWDCGIETYGEVASATLSKNTIKNATNCGIGGWYYMSLRSSTIQDNTVSGSDKMFDFYHVHGLRPAGYKGPGSPAETGVYFTDNNFEGNTFTNSYVALGGGFSSHIPFQNAGKYLDYDGDINASDIGEVAPSPSQFHLSNNKFSKNNFGAKGNNAYFGEPALKGAVVDKGGNVCSRTPFSDYPLSCGKPH